MTPLPPDPAAPPAAWYADPGGSGGLRYWDGRQWTGHVTPPPPVAPIGFGSRPPGSPAPAAPPRRRLWPIFAVIGVLFLLALGAAIAVLVPRAVRAGSALTDTAAQETAREGMEAARGIRADEGTFFGATAERLTTRVPDTTFTTGESTDFTTASIYGTVEEFTIAVRSLSGRCYVIIDAGGTETTGRMQPDRPCLAAHAFGGIVPEEF